MRPYTTTSATPTAGKLLVTLGGTTRTVATLPDPQVATSLADALTRVAEALLVDTAAPAYPDALRILGVRRTQVNPRPGVLAVSVLADQPGPDLTVPGGAWRSTGFTSIFWLGHVLHHARCLPPGPARSLRRELADLLAAADGLVVPATTTADGYDAGSITLNVTGWLASATDEQIAEILSEDLDAHRYGAGYGSGQIAWDLEALTAPFMRDGFTVTVDRVALDSWVAQHRPHLAGEDD
jgi:hypothetical protein